MPVDSDYFDTNYFKYVIYNGTPYNRETAGRIFMNWAMSLFSNYNPESVLDVGCGYGYLVEALRLGGTWSIGVDWSEHCVAVAASENNKFVTRADVRDGLPQFETSQFNVVTSYNMLDRIPITDLNKAIKSLIRPTQQPILVELMVNKDDRNPDMSGLTGDLSLCSVYSPGFWQKLFANHGCVLFEANVDPKTQKGALLFMKQQTPRKAFEEMNENRVRQIFLRLGLHEEHEIKVKEEFEKMSKDDLIDMIVEKNEALVAARSKQDASKIVKTEGGGVRK